MTLTHHEVLPGVFHIVDAVGVCMTLLVGSKQALLVDVGYGTEDVQAYVRTITQLPLTVIVTHGHHDHCMGVRWFDETFMFAEDVEDFLTYTGEDIRLRILDSAAEKGIPVDREDYLSAKLETPKPLQEQCLELGGMTAQIIHCPGHTPGSCVVYVPEHKLLLSDDDWNPCTWIFFPKALDFYSHRRNVRGLLELPFEHVLCSHQPVLFPRKKMQDFLDNLTDEALQRAYPVKISPYEDINTYQLDVIDEQILVFDADKAGLTGK